MSRRFAIPLSYSPIDTAALGKKLDLYTDRLHTDLITDFEQELKVATGVAHVVAVNTGTAAIHLALQALGVREEDRVIVSTFTYVASVSPILYLGAVPVLVDCEPLTWNIDPDLLEDAIVRCQEQGRKPKAIIVVHTYGMPARMEEILKIAKHYQVPVLEDAAEAIGSMLNGKALGSLGDVGTLSFNNNKILTTYGGGAVLTNNGPWAAQMLSKATHARKNLPYYEHVEAGFNYRMGPLNAAMGLVELAILDTNVAARRNNFNLYQQLLSDAGLTWQSEPLGGFSNRWFTCALASHNLARLRTELDHHDIETRPLWKPMHRQPLFKECMTFLNGTSDGLFATGVCLPSSNSISSQDIEFVSTLIKAALT